MVLNGFKVNFKLILLSLFINNKINALLNKVRVLNTLLNCTFAFSWENVITFTRVMLLHTRVWERREWNTSTDRNSNETVTIYFCERARHVESVTTKWHSTMFPSGHVVDVNVINPTTLIHLYTYICWLPKVYLYT